MSKSTELRKLRNQTEQTVTKINVTTAKLDKAEDHLGQIKAEYHRVAEISHSAPAVIENIDRQFKGKTQLCDYDIAFLMLATAIQCARQYILSNDKFRISAADGDRIVSEMLNDAPDWKKILTQSVPYDAIRTGTHISDTGLAGTTHRYRTLGHDPVLGWIFGTANIMTNSLTRYDLTSYQVSNMTIIRHYPNGTMGMLEKAAQYAQNDKMLLSVSVARQAIHFGSDYFTKQGLPIPGLMMASDNAAGWLIKNGNIDFRSILRSAGIAALINSLISVVHGLFYNEARDGSHSMYQGRTRKILSYSNALATCSNVIVTTLTQDLRKLDVGGMLVALHRFVSDYNFIQNVKRDFLKDEIYKKVVGQPYDFMEE